jgi:uncharacterized membrane protein
MKLLVVSLLLILTGCQDYNSNSNDKNRFKQVTLTGSANFNSAYYIIQERCTTCHTEYANYTNEQDWIDQGLATAGDADGSRVIFRIINNGGTDSDMPLGLGPLPNDEYQDLVDWVNGIP